MSATDDGSREPAGKQGAADASQSARRRQLPRHIQLDRSLELLPIFRLSDSSDDGALEYLTSAGQRWRVLPHPGDRIPGTFDQDVYVELMRRYQDAGSPEDGGIDFTLHSFLRSIGRRADGRTYGQLRSALSRLQDTLLESGGAWFDAATNEPLHGSFTILTAVNIQRRRAVDLEQLPLFGLIAASEPGEARVVLSQSVRSNLRAGYTSLISTGTYTALRSPVARRIYRLLSAFAAAGERTVRLTLSDLALMLPLVQRYPSHLVRVLHPANQMLLAVGAVAGATVEQLGGEWMAEYALPVGRGG